MARERKNRVTIMARRGLDLVEEIDGLVEEPETGQAGGREQRQQKQRSHQRMLS